MWEAHNFAFFPSPTIFFLHLSDVLSWNFGGVLKRRDPQMCTFGVLNETTPREGRKNENCGGRQKKNEKFWAVRRRGVREESPNLGCTHEYLEHTPTTPQWEVRRREDPWPKKQDMNNATHWPWFLRVKDSSLKFGP